METNHFKQIDDYLLDRLTKAEARAFEEEMAKDRKLFHQVKLCRELKEAVLEEDIDNLRQKLIKTSQINLRKKRMFKFMSLKVAAAVAVFVVATFLIWENYSSPKHLFENNYTRFEVSGIVRGDYENSNQLQSHIIEIYGEGKLIEAIPLLENYIQNRPADALARLMLSSAYIENNMAPKVEALVENLIDQNQNGIYTETAQWYLCLAYLTQEKYKEAFIVSSNIKAQGGRYAQSAKMINERLMRHLK